MTYVVSKITNIMANNNHNQNGIKRTHNENEWMNEPNEAADDDEDSGKGEATKYLCACRTHILYSVKCTCLDKLCAFRKRHVCRPLNSFQCTMYLQYISFKLSNEKNHKSVQSMYTQFIFYFTFFLNSIQWSVHASTCRRWNSKRKFS